VLRATITVTLTVEFEKPEDGKWQEAAIAELHNGLHRALYDDFEPFVGSIGGEIIEPHVDAIEEVAE
jgi:hypothetical protein